MAWWGCQLEGCLAGLLGRDLDFVGGLIQGWWT